MYPFFSLLKLFDNDWESSSVSTRRNPGMACRSASAVNGAFITSFILLGNFGDSFAALSSLTRTNPSGDASARCRKRSSSLLIFKKCS
eukprot:CAMPEP_0171311416 /NCGR_PEP_ID=MMETSP0816-20121228/21668_1 /TAXON_ID=420281 /ORGANISM="Proboscia inermis, Strain CCAP1064/1" /LENGTH=87 /DNA_ID=CAMNT_0011796181 /DNA_START=205 /DNA_END=464 /DNA_ORIENTATION=+